MSAATKRSRAKGVLRRRSEVAEIPWIEQQQRGHRQMGLKGEEFETMFSLKKWVMSAEGSYQR